MLVLVVYDISERKVTTALKICREYLSHIQYSVFLGEIKDSDYKELKMRLNALIDREKDSVILFKFRTENAFKKEILGVEKNKIDNII